MKTYSLKIPECDICPFNIEGLSCGLEIHMDIEVDMFDLGLGGERFPNGCPLDDGENRIMIKRGPGKV